MAEDAPDYSVIGAGLAGSLMAMTKSLPGKGDNDIRTLVCVRTLPSAALKPMAAAMP